MRIYHYRKYVPIFSRGLAQLEVSVPWRAELFFLVRVSGGDENATAPTKTADGSTKAPDWSNGKQLEREKSVDPPNSPPGAQAKAKERKPGDKEEGAKETRYLAIGVQLVCCFCLFFVIYIYKGGLVGGCPNLTHET